MYRLFHIALFAAAAIAAVVAVKGELSGKVSYRPNRWAPRQVCYREQEPEHFRDIMTYRWTLAFAPALTGWIILGFVRRQESLDPFSPNFHGSHHMDDPDESTGRRGREP